MTHPSTDGRVGPELGELRDLIATLLYEHDPMCGNSDCEYTARKFAPDIFEWASERFSLANPDREGGGR